jgi:protein-tyrosine-phosphatase
MKKVLFVCTGNTCRSPMAMAIFNNIAKNRGMEWQADSAGLASFCDPVNEKSVNALDKIGINNFSYTSKRVNLELLDKSDLIITMEDAHKSVLKYSCGIKEEKIIVLGDGIPDPYGGTDDVYFECLKTIEAEIKKLLDRGFFNDRKVRTNR